MDIKVIALDIWGTVLPSDDADKELRPRNGIESFLEECERRKIKVVSASDAPIETVRIDMVDYGINIERFDRFYQLKMVPKNFSQIISDYGIKPRELLVIGDTPGKDIEGAIIAGAEYRLVNSYRSHQDDFDFSRDVFKK
ncbi:MAG: HAD family hydrolase [archaeon]